MCDCVFTNANVITMDSALPNAELVAVRGSRIAAIGDVEMLQDFQKTNTRVIDCDGKTVLPGFIDAHCHVVAYAESLISLDLSPEKKGSSIDGIQDRIRQYCAQVPSGTWVRGKGYNEFYISEKRHPNRWDLDAAAPRHPVKLTHRSGHAHVLNSLALKEAGIDSSIGDPPGGIIDRSLQSGEPTGILYGMHSFLSDKIPGVDETEIERGLKLADSKLLTYGITSVQDASYYNGLKQWKRFESWKERKIFHPRVTMMMGMMGREAFEAFDKKSFASVVGENDLCLGGVKIMVDRVTGDLQPSGKALNAIAASIHKAGFQAAIHALEEPVVTAAVEAVECAVRQHPRDDSRHRIEHCSVCRPPVLRKLAELGGMVVTQPAFLFHEGDRYLETVESEELEHLYPIAAMIGSGLRVAAGSDAPVGDLNPMTGIGAAVTRSSSSGRPLPGRGISRIQAIRMYTSDAAAVNYEENIKGSISPGKLADFIVLDEDPFAVPTDHIKDIRVIMTVLGGKIVYRKPGAVEY